MADVQTPLQWRVKAPVSKADRDAILAFERANKRRGHLMSELRAVELQCQKLFEVLVSRGQAVPVPVVVPVGA